MFGFEGVIDLIALVEIFRHVAFQFFFKIIRGHERSPYIGVKIIHLDCVIGRRGMTIQLSPSILAK
jgi:hypothetical protein